MTEVVGNIFINYRREDSIESAGRIYDRLVIAFGKEMVFKDVDNIPFGTDFPSYIQRFIHRSAVMLVIIGRQWDTLTDSQGVRRLDKPNDFVRLEIEGALQRSVPIIPVLVQHASMLSSERFPASIQKVAYLNSIDVRTDPDFNKDIELLIRAVSEILNPPPPDGLTLSDAIASTMPGYYVYQQDVTIYPTFWKRLFTGARYEVQLPNHLPKLFKTIEEAEQYARDYLDGKYDEHRWFRQPEPDWDVNLG